MSMSLIPVFFNNCCARDHVDHYGANAFYDLKVAGPQAKKATGLKPGTECIVATQSKDRQVTTFCWFAFSHEKIMEDKEGVGYRVLFGDQIWSKKMPKRQAANTEFYKVFVNKLGHFKQQSVVEGRLAKRR